MDTSITMACCSEAPEGGATFPNESLPQGLCAPAPIRECAMVESVKGIDLFAGAGGFSLGALGAGVDVVGALEFQKHAANTYEQNILRADGSKMQVINNDILKVTPIEALQTWNLQPAECDIVMGGPPCQGFSSHRILDAGVGDPRNELLCRYFEYVEVIRPRVFVVENVPGLLWKRHAEYLKRFYEMGAAADYDLRSPVILNARDFGVPQSRRRVFILGIDRRRPVQVSWPPEPTHVGPGTVESERNDRPDWLAAETVFGAAKANDPNDVHMNHGEALVELFRNTPINGGSRVDSGRVLDCHKNHDGHLDVYGRIDPSKPGPTMTTACINPSKGRFVHPTENHGITLRQAARLQTFPDSFDFTGGLTSGGVQIGNAVPVKLAEAIIAALVRALRDENAV